MAKSRVRFCIGWATCPNRGETFFRALADEIRTLSWAPDRRILKANRNRPHREVAA
jgi:hypothetical protein